MTIRTEKGIVMENILKGVDNSGLWNIFVEMMFEVKKRTRQRRMLAITASCKDESTTWEPLKQA